MTKRMPIKLLVVDDHFIVREGLQSLIRKEADMMLAGEATDGIQAVEAYERLRPDVTIMDLRMPLRGGLEATRMICKKYPMARILILSSFEGDEDIHAAFEAGAMGYLLKHSSREQIVSAIRALMASHKWIPSDVAGHLAARSRHEPLTPREKEIVHLLAAGLANKQIADAFNLTEGTIKWHLKNILGKLRVPDRTAAVTVSLRRGIIHLPQG